MTRRNSKYVSKANWSRGELKRIRKALVVVLGSGPRADAEIREELVRIKGLDAMGRVEIRRSMAGRG